MTWLEPAAVELYFACVDFLVNLARLAGVTYRDASAALFFLLWPAVTVGLAATSLGLALGRRQGRVARRRPPEPG